MEDVLQLSAGTGERGGALAKGGNGTPGADRRPPKGDDAPSDDAGDGVPADDAPADDAGDDAPAGDAGDGAPAGDGTAESFHCDRVIPAGVDEADGRGNYADVGPGDVVCLPAGTRGPLELRNFHGADGRAITFVNDGGTVTVRGDGGDYAGIEIEDSDHIRVTGAGTAAQCGAGVAASAQRCGIRILGAARSLTGKVKTEYIRVDHIEMGDTTQAAVSIKDNSMGRGEWIEHDVVLEHNYIHDVYDEGVYIGSSDYASGDYHVLNGVHLGHNLVVNTGRDGLQVGSTTSDCTIHHNVIRGSGRNRESEHGAGVMNNKGSVCDIFNNLVTDTAGWGIYVQGNGGNEVYNNVIVRAGRAVSSGDGDGDGISVHEGSNVRGSIAVWNNTVVAARGDGIGWGNDVGTDNQIRNNLVVGSGGANIDRDANVLVSHNLTASSASPSLFADAGADDYRLRADSAARDSGASLSSRGVTHDFSGVPRPQGPAYDVGAHEYSSG